MDLSFLGVWKMWLEDMTGAWILTAQAVVCPLCEGSFCSRVCTSVIWLSFLSFCFVPFPLRLLLSVCHRRRSEAADTSQLKKCPGWLGSLLNAYVELLLYPYIYKEASQSCSRNIWKWCKQNSNLFTGKYLDFIDFCRLWKLNSSL